MNPSRQATVAPAPPATIDEDGYVHIKLDAPTSATHSLAPTARDTPTQSSAKAPDTSHIQQQIQTAQQKQEQAKTQAEQALQGTQQAQQQIQSAGQQAKAASGPTIAGYKPAELLKVFSKPPEAAPKSTTPPIDPQTQQHMQEQAKQTEAQVKQTEKQIKEGQKQLQKAEKTAKSSEKKGRKIFEKLSTIIKTLNTGVTPAQSKQVMKGFSGIAILLIVIAVILLFVKPIIAIVIILIGVVQLVMAGMLKKSSS